MISRRHFAGIVAGIVAGTAAVAGSGMCAESRWGTPVIDIHLHPRRNEFLETDHLEGSGCARAVLLPGAATENRARLLVQKYPKRFSRFTSQDVREPDAIAKMRESLQSGAIGLGELKSPGVQIDGPEMRHAYDLAAEFHVPVLMHFQEGDFNSGIERLPSVLRQHSTTTFIAHANSWWANISRTAPTGGAYPKGPVEPNGLSDRLLSEFSNLYGDLSANSGRNAMQRDEEFARGFLVRHQDKLLYGSDCPCQKGEGGGTPPVSPSGKCLVMETLTTVKKLTSPEQFAKITYGNAAKLLRLK